MAITGGTGAKRGAGSDTVASGVDSVLRQAIEIKVDRSVSVIER